MVNIAVAGGLGSVGKTIVDVLVQSSQHSVTILSSQVNRNHLRYASKFRAELNGTRRSLRENTPCQL